MGQYFTSGELATLFEALGYTKEALQKEISVAKNETFEAQKSTKVEIDTVTKELNGLKKLLTTTSKRLSTLTNLLKKI